MSLHESVSSHSRNSLQSRFKVFRKLMNQASSIRAKAILMSPAVLLATLIVLPPLLYVFYRSAYGPPVSAAPDLFEARLNEAGSWDLRPMGARSIRQQHNDASHVNLKFAT